MISIHQKNIEHVGRKRKLKQFLCKRHTGHLAETDETGLIGKWFPPQLHSLRLRIDGILLLELHRMEYLMGQKYIENLHISQEIRQCFRLFDRVHKNGHLVRFHILCKGNLAAAHRCIGSRHMQLHGGRCGFCQTVRHFQYGFCRCQRRFFSPAGFRLSLVLELLLPVKFALQRLSRPGVKPPGFPVQ